MPSRYSERLSFYDCTRAPRYVVRELENQPLAAGSDSLTVRFPPPSQPILDTHMPRGFGPFSLISAEMRGNCRGQERKIRNHPSFKNTWIYHGIFKYLPGGARAHARFLILRPWARIPQGAPSSERLAPRSGRANVAKPRYGPRALGTEKLYGRGRT